MTDMSLCIYMVREEKGYRPFKRASFFLHCWPKMLISQEYEKQKNAASFSEPRMYAQNLERKAWECFPQ